MKKFRRSLKKAGATQAMIDTIASKIKNMPEMRSTREIYDFALAQLQEQEPALAARYNIKRALFEMGPAGFPFEHFVAALFAEMGYTNVQKGVLVKGWCVDHEVDVVAEHKDSHCMIECKFHNRPGLKTDVKVALYIQSRFQDIEKAWQADPGHNHKFHDAWIATNTKFTSQAIEYAECVGLKLLGWSYPAKNNLQTLIDKYELHPITALVSLTKQQKRAFIKEGFVLCRDAEKHKALLKKLGFSQRAVDKLVQEAMDVCKI